MTRLIKAFLVAALLPAASLASTLGHDISDFYVFGDSTSDIGRAFALTGGAIPPTPPYYMGQFTGPDGPVWAQIVGDALAAGGAEVRNYAVGGATALGLGPTDLAAQIGAFSLDVASGSTSPGDHALAALWIGGNDIFPGLDKGTARDAANAVTASAFALSALGIDSYLFFTYGDLAQIPAFRGSPLAAAAQAAGQAYDSQLRTNVSILDALGFDAGIADSGALLAAAMADPDAFGFTNVTDACVVRNGTTILQDCTTTPGADPNGYLWFDTIHPSSKAHAAIAAGLIDDPAPVPLPASAPLLAGGLLLLLGFRRKSRTV